MAGVRSSVFFFDTPTIGDTLELDRQVHDVDTGAQAGLAASPPDRQAHRGPKPPPYPITSGSAGRPECPPMVTISRSRTRGWVNAI